MHKVRIINFTLSITNGQRNKKCPNITNCHHEEDFITTRNKGGKRRRKNKNRTWFP
uniref:Uncharacterized protein n=1 Tax=Rhizophora mucronata TaxID=61149 RepID=A0A2P2PEY0_RHIMU